MPISSLADENASALPSPRVSAFAGADLIKEIGRGKKGARSLSQDGARQLYAAMLAGAVPDLELGAILLAMRIKGESVAEIAGFLQAAEASFAPLSVPIGAHAPVVLPSYNGARQLPNLTPLLALLLAREGIPVLLHGVMSDPKRVTSADILHRLGIEPAQSVAQAQEQLQTRSLALLPIDILAPQLAQQLALRIPLGVRNSAHTLVKILQPFNGPALRLVSYTHPEYLEMLGTYFAGESDPARGDVLLMRGTEGETVAHPRRAPQIDCFSQGQRTTLMERQAPVDEWPPLPSARDAATTAAWIKAALEGKQAVPAPLLEQVAQCIRLTAQLAAKGKNTQGVQVAGLGPAYNHAF